MKKRKTSPNFVVKKKPIGINTTNTFGNWGQYSLPQLKTSEQQKQSRFQSRNSALEQAKHQEQTMQTYNVQNPHGSLFDVNYPYSTNKLKANQSNAQIQKQNDSIYSTINKI